MRSRRLKLRKSGNGRWRVPCAAGMWLDSEARYHCVVIRRFYVHNFRCLENFELPISGQSSILLIGNNGSGKTTVGLALEVLQKIARNINRVHDLVDPKDLARKDVPVRFEITVEIQPQPQVYDYSIAFEFPPGFRELRVLEENLSVNGRPIYTRQKAQVNLTDREKEARFSIDWHLVALPIVQEQSLGVFKQWLARMLILRPVPGLIKGSSDTDTLEPNIQVTNFGAWFSGLVASAPSAYSKIDEYLKEVMPDLKDIKNPAVGKDTRNLVVQFSVDQRSLNIDFEDLADGEKCFMICALLLAANYAYGPLTCFWDEPDSYIGLSEVEPLIMALRKEFQSRGQFIATSQNPGAIRRFSDENTFVLQRRSHLEPTTARRLEDFKAEGDLVGALVRGDLEL